MNKLEFVAYPRRNQMIPALHTLEGKYMPLTTGFEIHKANEYLRTLTSQEVVFFNFYQYECMIYSISAEISK